MSGASSGGDKPDATISIDPPPAFDLVFDAVHVVEKLGRPFEIALDVSAPKATGDLMSLLGASVTVSFQKSGTSSDMSHFNGILTKITYAGLTEGAPRYKIELRPWLWLLSRTQDCKIYQNQSAWDIITSVLRDAGFSEFQDKRQNQSGEMVLENCVQYHETSLDFVSRLMEQFGIYYFFEHDDSKHTLIFADDPNSHTALPDAIPYQRQMTESRAVADHVWGFTSELALQPGTYTMLDYNFTTPSADLTAKSIQPGAHPYGTSEVFVYPGPYDTAANGQKLADIRMQAMAAKRQTIGGTTNARGIQTGVKFTLSQFQDTAMNQAYVVIGTTTTLGMGESKSSTQTELSDTFSCVFEAVPATVPFRTEATTPRPIVRGPQTARVVGATGDEITTDQYGRVKVKFFWDRSAAQDETASCWIRVSQTAAGQGFGGMSVPRIGEEVIVEFLDGNPDRPIITGRVYNANVTVPYALPDNKTRITTKTNSSQGGGGFNELRFEDKKGSEEVFLQAQKDFNRVVVMGNDTHTIQQGDHSFTVTTGKHSTTVSASDHVLTVSAGNHTITVSAGQSSITAAQSIALTVGGSSIKIAPDGVTISAAQITVNANATMSLQAGGPLTVQGATVAIN
jgi:type VI secretion system secreted protein VgrG